MYLNNSQTYVFATILLLILCFAACEKGILGSPLNSFGEKVELRKNESSFFGSDANNGLKVSVSQINDNRCPSNVNCIRAGEAGVKLTIFDVKENAATFDLYFGDRSNFKPDTVDFSINQKKYSAILFGVNPYPKSGINQDSSKAIITLLNK